MIQIKQQFFRICICYMHIKHGVVPKGVPGITVDHKMVGVVEAVGSEVRKINPGDRVAVNVETFCEKCFFCRDVWVNNCTDPNGGWALGYWILIGGRTSSRLAGAAVEMVVDETGGLQKGITNCGAEEFEPPMFHVIAYGI